MGKRWDVSISSTNPLSGWHLFMVNDLISPQSQQMERQLTTVWQSLTPTSCPRFYNFHLHTRCSDGQMSPEGLIEQAIHQELRGLAITDHHCVAGYYRAQRWLTEHCHYPGPRPQLWTGIEITANLDGTEVHILGYDFDPTQPVLTPYLTGDRPDKYYAQAAKVIKALHDAGGLVVLAHPTRYRQPASQLIPAAARHGIDGVEAFYAYGNPKPWQSSVPQMEEVCYLGDLYNLFRTCGTDSHGESIMYRL
ncbi:PHP domain-containing protein [Synechocystis sp. PCC 7338]|uniref:PHP domain-containing protein n=1 Tax=Synechocystis sp. PCC 7338 TaxID=2732530 RepID=UPI001BB05AEC|nr:PHP domain-containing protein [Synechocystis sp. PCC 7338]QUS59707.1 PHP domain-containing protein [Synechocystis sp. PCC 7338]